MKITKSIILLALAVLFAAGCASGSQNNQGEAQATVTVIQPPTTEPLVEAATSTPTMEAQAAPTDEPADVPVDVAQPTATSTSIPDATSFPDPAGYEWQVVANGFNSSIGVESPGDGTGRLFVIEQAGKIRMIKDGAVAEGDFLDITDRVGSSGNEQGLLGIVFHPNFAENGYFYVNYTDKNGDTHISRFQVGDNPDQASPDSEKELLFVDQPYANHNGGDLEFGPEGYLYIALGDGGSAGDPRGNAQSLDTLLGKILRIDVDNGDPYAIPADNPLAGGGGKPEIFAYGLRNPFRFSFDRMTGDMWIGDVGQNAYEEVDYLPAGSPPLPNFGWDYREAAHPFEGNPPADVTLIDPVAEYGRSLGVAVTGGVVYRGQALPEWQGIYLYADHYTGNMWGLLRAEDGTFQNELLFQVKAFIADFSQDEAGEVLIASRNGEILKLVRK